MRARPSYPGSMRIRELPIMNDRDAINRRINGYMALSSNEKKRESNENRGVEMMALFNKFNIHYYHLQGGQEWRRPKAHNKSLRPSVRGVCYALVEHIASANASLLPPVKELFATSRISTRDIRRARQRGSAKKRAIWSTCLAPVKGLMKEKRAC